MPTQPLRTLIVDDEPVARQVLRQELEDFDDVMVLGEAGNGREALEQIETLSPDLVFLDVQMPVIDGFGVLRSLDSYLPPAIIFVTAYDEYAIKAFEVGALDYLLKPVAYDRLLKGLERARGLQHNPRPMAEGIAQVLNEGQSPRLRKMVGRRGKEYHLLNPDEIQAFQAEGEIVWILTAKHRYMATLTLQALESRLRGTPFRRVHRNALVNTNHIRKMSTLSSQRWLLTLTNGIELIVSKRQAHLMRDVLR